MTESGTYVNGQLEGLHRGEKIARWTTEKKSRSGNTTIVGGVLTHVLRPVEETYMEERIDYVTPYSLIDFERTSVINPAEFPDLELTARRIPVVLDEVVTINLFGSQVFDVCRERPCMTERIFERAHTVSVELILKRTHLLRTGIHSLLES